MSASIEKLISVKEGSIVYIDDQLAMEQSLHAGKGVKAQEYLVKSVEQIEGCDSQYQIKTGVNFILITLWNTSDDSYATIIVKVIRSKDIDVLYVCFKPMDDMDRGQLIANDARWLFVQPDDPDNFIPSELSYAKYPDVPAIEEDGTEIIPSFKMKDVGILFGTRMDYTGRNRTSCMIGEYENECEVSKNSIMFVVESSYLDVEGNLIESGGNVEVFLGCVVDIAQITVL